MKSDNCPVCGTPRVWSSGRGTYACPKCYPSKRKRAEGSKKWEKKDVEEVA